MEKHTEPNSCKVSDEPAMTKFLNSTYCSGASVNFIDKLSDRVLDNLPSERGIPYLGVNDSILDCVGFTPMIRLNRIMSAYNLECDLLAKCEFFNIGGSAKDRIAVEMVKTAESKEELSPNATLIEPTSGNTGIALALTAAVKNLSFICTLPEKMSTEKVCIMKALGAEILRTPTEACWNSPDSHIALAHDLLKTIPNSILLNQYLNPSNPLAHYNNTAMEIYEQCGGDVDAIVAGAGTGGTVTGIGARFKQLLPQCKIIAVDPYGSILARPESLNSQNENGPYDVEGIGYDFIPGILDHQFIDEWIKTGDKEAFRCARDLIRLEGLLCGGSSGSALSAAIQVCKRMKKGQRCVVVLPDSSRNYLTKFLDDSWMIDREYMESEKGTESQIFAGKFVTQLHLETPVTILHTASIANAIELMYSKGIDQVPVVYDHGGVFGVVTEGHLATLLKNQRVKMSDPISKASFKKFKEVSITCPLSVVSCALDVHPFVIVISKQSCFLQSGQIETRKMAIGIVTRIDLLRFLELEMGKK